MGGTGEDVDCYVGIQTHLPHLRVLQTPIQIELKDEAHQGHVTEHSRKAKLSVWVHVMEHVQLALVIFTKKRREKMFQVFIR